MTVSCNAAVNRYCRQNGFVSGLEIDESSPTSAQFSCVRACGAAIFSAPWSELNAASCSFANAQTQPGICMTAAHRYCVGKGFAVGFGVQEMSASAGQVVCLTGS
jgi:hypothetical protein